MKYFNEEYYKLDTNEEGNRIRSIQCKKYWDEFDSCAHRLPKSFVKYYKQHGFHDDILEKLEVVKRRTKGKKVIDIITQFRAGKQLYEICYNDVVKFETSLNVEEYCEIGDYLDGEILPVDDKYMSHEFGFYDYESEILIHFRKLQFRKIRETAEQQEAAFAAIYPAAARKKSKDRVLQSQSICKPEKTPSNK